ncbi:MAG: TlpA family protein disulfide reductase [Alphaproteobacteria bacterium GM7ARS4]|nr:TlpA family protein disulfide reductase [Alphaproteobacteria bacterium GM7ARS4]
MVRNVYYRVGGWFFNLYGMRGMMKAWRYRGLLLGIGLVGVSLLGILWGWTLSLDGGLGGKGGGAALRHCAFDGAEDRVRHAGNPVKGDDMALSFLDGDIVLLSSLRGRVIVMNFWATWCPPCIEELPSLLALQQTMSGEDVIVILVAADFAEREAIDSFLARHGLEALRSHHDKDLSLSGVWRIGSMPTTLIMDRKGREVWRHEGACAWDGEDVVSFLRALP